jgi:hypothetical protein
LRVLPRAGKESPAAGHILGARIVTARAIGDHAARLVLVALALLALPARSEPDYPHGEYSERCTLCHGRDGWTPAVIGPEFKHDSFGFDLTGAHRQSSCRACHATLEFSAVEGVCATCHSDVHENELGTDCARCHTTRSFIDRFEMERAHALTRFTLRGAHRAADCEACHRPSSGGRSRFVGTPIDCVACHRDSFLAATDPSHVENRFPTECEGCHSSLAWIPASFSHGSVAGTPCVNCHLGDYQSATDPNHQQAGFPQACEVCHSTTRWTPADYGDHDALYFPIYSGRHDGEWNTCSDCHTVSGSFPSFSCIDCHEHSNSGQVLNDHDEVPGFQYTSQACYSCHPNGN